MDDISDYFIHPTITSVNEHPNRESTRNLQRKMHENAASIPHELGGGVHGYLGVTMSNAEYASKFRTNFTPHVHPGPLPDYSQNTTQHQIAAAKNLHTRGIKLFNEQRKVTQASRNLVVQYYKEQCIKPMCEECVGHNNRSILELFQCLFDTFGTITYRDLEKMRKI